MGFFKNIFGGEKKKTPESSNNSAWDKVGDVPFNNQEVVEEEVQPNARQQRKILAAYFSPESDFGNIISTPDATISDEIRDDMINTLATNGVDAAKKRAFIDMIAGPTNAENGIDNVLNTFKDGREMYIMSSLVGGAGTSDARGLLNRLLDNCPSPMDFEEENERFLNELKRINGDDAYRSYQKATRELEKKIYGKKYEYYTQMKMLDKEIEDRRANGPDVSSAEAMEGVDDGALRRKMIVSLVAEEGDISELLETDDVDLSESDANSVLEYFRKNPKGLLARERLVVNKANSSYKNMESASNAIRGFSSHREYRILSDLTGVSEGRLTGEEIMKIGKMFPTPYDFEGARKRYLDDIEKLNGVRKREQYEEAMDSFERCIYGQKYDCYKEFMQLNDEIRDSAAERSEVPKMQDYRSMEQRYERELSHEWAPGDFSFCQVSRGQTADGSVTRSNLENGLWSDERCEDSYMAYSSKQIYGVFDGAGGMGNGRLASQTAMRKVRELCDGHQPDGCKDLASILNVADGAVVGAPGIGEGCTTGVLAAVVKREGRHYLAYANVGDSRIYVVDKGGKATMITVDEGAGNVIDNALGGRKAEVGNCCKQYDEIPLREGDRVVLCSDGITGDFGADLMSPEEIATIVSNSANASDASKNLVSAARKRDDRTAIVFAPRLD